MELDKVMNGHHILGMLSDVKILTTEELAPKMDRVISELGLTEVGRCFYQFEPYGATGVILLSESHFSVHTYPEHNSIQLDLYCCSDTFDTNRATDVIMKIFDADLFQWEYVKRV